MYNKTNWQKRVRQFLNRILLTTTGTANEYDVTQVEGTVTTIGTPFSSDLLNNMESAIAQMADYAPSTVVARQIRVTPINADMTRVFFKLNANLIEGTAVTISLDGGATSFPLRKADGVTNVTRVDLGFVEVVRDSSFFILRARGVDTSDATALASDVLAPKTVYVNSNKITGTIPSKTAQTYTPSTVNQTISSGQYLSGTQTIIGDTDLAVENIKSGVNIFGVAGTFTSDATALASDMLASKTAYVNSNKITGTIPSKTAQTYNPSTSTQTITSGQYLTGDQTINGSVNLVSGNIKSGVNIFGVVGSVTPRLTATGTAINTSVNLGWQPTCVCIGGRDFGIGAYFLAVKSPITDLGLVVLDSGQDIPATTSNITITATGFTQSVTNGGVNYSYTAYL